MASSASENAQLITSINVTPMVDVVLVLLIIFMAAAPLIQKKSLNVNVPKAANTETKATSALEVFYAADGRILMDDAPVPFEEVAGQMAFRLRLNANLHVSISADEAIPYGRVVELLDSVRGAGVKKIALEVKQKKK